MRTISTTRKKPLDTDLQTVDEIFSVGGLVHSGRSARRTQGRPARFDRSMPDELTPPAPAPVVAANGVRVLKIPSWQSHSWLWHGFSTRQGGQSQAYTVEGSPGELNLGFTAADDREAVISNRRLLAEATTGSAATPLITLRQCHSKMIAVASVNRDVPARGDGLMTAEAGLLLAVQTADCIPVLVADRRLRVVAAFHAGWRGTVQRIVESGIGKMRLEFNSRPKDLVAAIGPGIGACCYAVGEEVLSAFESQFTYARDLFHEVYDTDSVRTKFPMLFLTQRAPGHSPIGPSLHLDLIEANRRQLLDAGLWPDAIHAVGGCTSCHSDLFFSHRASKGHAGRMMSVIGIAPKLVDGRFQARHRSTPRN